MKQKNRELKRKLLLRGFEMTLGLLLFYCILKSMKITKKPGFYLITNFISPTKKNVEHKIVNILLPIS